MTLQEKRIKLKLLEILAAEGFMTYARILRDPAMEIREISEDEFQASGGGSIAYMEPGKGRIHIYPGLLYSQVSVLVRHEILHEYLRHEQRLIDHLGKKHKELADDISNLPVEELEEALKNELYSTKEHTGSYSIANIAGDYEISRYYTAADKDTIRNIIINGRAVRGLIVEDDHPDWVGLSVEELYDKVLEEENKLKSEMPDPPKEGDGPGAPPPQGGSQGDSQKPNGPQQPGGQQPPSGQQPPGGQPQPGQQPPGQQQGDQSQSGQSQGNNAQQSGSQNSQSDQGNNSGKNDGSSSGKDNERTITMHGKFIDEKTFLAPDGTIYKLEK